jgi:hypothetical protein
VLFRKTGLNLGEGRKESGISRDDNGRKFKEIVN